MTPSAWTGEAVGRPRLTLAHLELLEQGVALDLPTLADPKRDEIELVAWGLLTWHGGAAKDGAGFWRTMNEGQVRITPAGLAALAAYELGRTCACDPACRVDPGP